MAILTFARAKAFLAIAKLNFKTKFGRQIFSRFPSVKIQPVIKRILINKSHFAFNYNSVVRNMSRLIIQSSTHTRPNSLIRTFNCMASIVRYRNEYSSINNFCINGFQSGIRPFSKLRSRFPAKMKMSFLNPEKYIANGCYGAVWAAKYAGPDAETTNISDSSDLAVKVLYNYYAASEAETGSSGSVDIVPENLNMQYLNKQVDRECNLRPINAHVNIVPVLGMFFDKAPPPPSSIDSATQGKWMKAEEFPEGFGGRPVTCYLLMPKFEGTLDDLLSGKWQPTQKLMPAKDSHSSICDLTSSMSLLNTPALQSNPTFRLETTEAVAMVAQIFESVAVLEKSHIAHRDVKANNILIQSRPLPDAIAVRTLNVSELETANARLHAALTDFGCAIRTDDSSPYSRYAEPSGNSALRAPEVATYFATPEQQRIAKGVDYSRADIWAAATIIYQIFGLENPFLSGELSSMNYDETKLPDLPNSATEVMSWVLKACLRRDPSTRPPAALVADILHVWCLIHHLKLQNPRMNTPTECSSIRQLASSNVYSDILKQCTFTTEDFITHEKGAEQAAHRFTGKLRRLFPRINNLLRSFWTYDLLLKSSSPARNGLRVDFYKRITPQRLVFCLNIIRYAGISRTLSYSNEPA